MSTPFAASEHDSGSSSGQDSAPFVQDTIEKKTTARETYISSPCGVRGSRGAVSHVLLYLAINDGRLSQQIVLLSHTLYSSGIDRALLLLGTMPRELDPPQLQAEFVLAALRASPPIRVDGRSPTQARKPELTFGDSLGWVECHMGKTR